MRSSGFFFTFSENSSLWHCFFFFLPFQLLVFHSFDELFTSPVLFWGFFCFVFGGFFCFLGFFYSFCVYLQNTQLPTLPASSCARWEATVFIGHSFPSVIYKHKRCKLCAVTWWGSQGAESVFFGMQGFILCSWECVPGVFLESRALSFGIVVVHSVRDLRFWCRE